eukprot:171552-Amphidinium_carterae.2
MCVCVFSPPRSTPCTKLCRATWVLELGVHPSCYRRLPRGGSEESRSPEFALWGQMWRVLRRVAFARNGGQLGSVCALG